MLPVLDEDQLVQGLKERREDAVRLFLERYRSLLQHCIASFESDPLLREDLFQELAWHALDRLQGDSYQAERGSFGTWLYRVAWCRCVDLKRRQSARKRVPVSILGDELPEQVDPAPGPREESHSLEIGELVRAALGAMGEEDRRLVQMRYAEGQEIQHVARALGISIEQVKYRLRRATAQLRRQLLKRLPREETVE